MDPRKKPDDLKGSQLAFLTSPFSTEPEMNPSHAVTLRLSDSESPHTPADRLTSLDIPHTTTGLRLPVSHSSHPGSLQLSDTDSMHSVGLRLPDADAVHATAMRLTDDADLHGSSLRLSDSDIPHSTGLRLPLSTTDYGLSNMYSMNSILSGTNDVRSLDLPKKDYYDIGLSRQQSMRFSLYNEEGRLPGISYMMSTQDSNMRAAGLDMTIPTLPPQTSISTALENQTPLSLITSHAFTNSSSTQQTLFSSRAYGMGGNESDTENELAEAAAAHSNLTEAQERFASHLGRMDMKSIIEATKLAVAQQQLNTLPPGPLDMKQHPDAKDIERQLIRDAEVLSRSLHPSVSDHLSSVSDHLPIDVSLPHHHDHTLTDMTPLTDTHVTDLTTADLSCPPNTGLDNSLTTDSPPSSPDKSKHLIDKRAIQSYWFHEFPWLLMDSTQNLFYCRYCMETSSDSIFAKGRSSLKPKKEHFVKHEQSDVHRKASRKFLGIDTQDSQDMTSTSQALNLDAMSLSWSSAPTTSTKLEEMQPVSTDFDTLTTNSVTINTMPDPAQKPTIIDSTNAHVLNLVISPRTLAETRAQFEGWFDEFGWLVYDAQLNVFLCKVCQQSGSPSLLSAGKSSEQLQRAPFEAHQLSNVHQEAAKTLQDDGTDDGSKDVESESEDETQTFRIRRIRPSWFLEFPWLELNQMDMCFYCKLCRLYKQPGIFSFGRPAGNPKKNNFLKHENTEGHKIAALQDAGISGEEAVHTVIAMQEMLNKENREKAAEKMPERVLEQTIIDVGIDKSSGQNIEIDLSKKVPSVSDSDPNRLLSGKTGLGRKIKLEWFLEFPWLELDENKNIFYCKLCRIYHPIGIYVSGKSAINPKRDDLRKHEATEGHKIAVNSHTRAGADGERRLENHSMDPSNAHLIDVTTVSQITQAQNKSSHNLSSTGSATSLPQVDDMTVPDSIAVSSCTLSTNSMSLPVSTITTPMSMISASNMTSVPTSDDWATQFPWYTVESPSNTAYCKVCRAESLTNALAQGVPVYIVMKKDCIVHEIIEEHQKAVENARKAEAQREEETKVKEQEAVSEAPQAKEASATKPAKSSHYVIEQVPLPPDAFAETKSPWKSSFWHLANQMRHLGILCDVTLTVGIGSDQRSYHVHKLLLVCSSELFKTYLRDNSLDNHYHFDNITAVGLEGILQYIYGQPLKGMTVEQSAACCAAAEVLLMPKAKELFQKSVVSPSGQRSKKKGTQTHNDAQLTQTQPPESLLPQTGTPVLLPQSVNSTVPEPVVNQTENTLPCGDSKEHVEDVVYKNDTNIREEEDDGQKDIEFQNDQVKNKTVGQLAKKPSIIGRMRPKDRIKTYNSLRSLQARVRKAKPKRESVSSPNSRRSIREPKTNGIKLPPDIADIAESLEQTLPPLPVLPLPTPPLPEQMTDCRGTKRAKKGKNQGKLAKQKVKEEENAKELEEDKEKDTNNEMDSLLDLPELGDLTVVTSSESDLEEGIVLDNDPMPSAFMASLQNSNNKFDMKSFQTDPLPTCEECGKRFLQPAFLAKHMETKHKEGGSSPPANHKCVTCGKGFTTRYDLKVHSRRHTGERPYLCNVCGKSFTRRETLIEHSYIHKPDAEKPHRCEKCGKGFYKIYDLQRHFVGIHSGAKPFQCHLCGKSFPWARSLSDHLQSHKGAARVRPYKCEECDMNFRRKYDLERHKVKHAAQKPFVCEWCGHGFTQKGSMDKHKREFCHGRPGASDSANRPAQKQTNKSNIKSESDNNANSTQASSDIPAGSLPNMITLTTEQRAQTTDIFQSFSPDTEPNSAAMLYYSI